MPGDVADGAGPPQEPVAAPEEQQMDPAVGMDEMDCAQQQMDE